jgi:hypothetical protein
VASCRYIFISKCKYFRLKNYLNNKKTKFIFKRYFKSPLIIVIQNFIIIQILIDIRQILILKME